MRVDRPSSLQYSTIVADKGSTPEIRELSTYRFLLALSKEELINAYIKMDQEHKERIRDLQGAIDALVED